MNIRVLLAASCLGCTFLHPHGLLGGPLLDRFFPLCQGDTKTFVAPQPAGTAGITVTATTYNGQPAFQMRITTGSGSSAVDQYRYFRTSGDSLLYLGSSFASEAGSFEAIFNPAIEILREGDLATGGVRSGSTSAVLRGAEVPGGQYNVNVNYSYDIGVGGTLSVPACTYAESRTIAGSFVLLDPADPEFPEILEFPEFLHLAPDVGMAKIRVYAMNQFEVLVPYGWADLAGGTVCGHPVCSGSLQANILPPEAVAAGAQWRRTGTTTWQDSGSSVTGLATGNAIVEFKPIDGWTTPSSRTVAIANGQVAQLTATYVRQLGALLVSIQPAGAVAAGARWRRTGTTTWRESGQIETAVPTGPYIVEFSPLPYWLTPSPSTVTISHSTTYASGVTYLMPPMLQSVPSHQTVTQGSPAQFSVHAAGTDPLSFAWSKDGIPLSDSSSVGGSRSNTLTLHHVSTNDSGATFVVTVTNPHGSTNTPPATLTVVLGPQAPLILTQPTDARAPAGSAASFETMVYGFPNPALQWWFSPQESFTEAQPLAGATNQTLSLPQVHTDHDGFYRLVASNSEGSATSRLARLTVVLPPQIVTQPSSLVSTQGQTARFEVSCTGTEPLQYQWRFQGADLPGETNRTLSLNNLQPRHAGTYQVSVRNEAGSTTSSDVSLAVLVPSAFTQHPQSQAACAGTTVSFTASASGSPAPAYQWRKDGAPLPGESSPTLTLANVQPSAAGLYDVLASNDAGAAFSTPAQLTVNQPPTVAHQPADQAATPGSTVHFDIVASGGSPFTYQWSKDGLDLPGETNAALVLVNVQIASSPGNYAARIVNLCGSTISRSASLAVVDRSVQVLTQYSTPGQKVTIPLQLVGNGSENRVRVSLDFNRTALLVSDVKPGSQALDATFTWSNQTNDELLIEVSLPADLRFPAGNSQLALVECTVSPTLTKSSTIPIEFGSVGQIAAPDGSDLPFSPISGTVDITGPEPPQVEPSSGLFLDKLIVAIPPSGLAANQAIRILIQDLGLDSQGRPIQVFNQSGLVDGIPYLLLNGPLPAGALFEISIQFIVLDRRTTPTPRYLTSIVPSSPPSAPTGSPIAIDPANVHFANGVFYLQFPTISGRTYFVQFKDTLDAPVWQTAWPPLTGTGGWIVWLDNGPPKTSPPTGQVRYYQAILTP